MRTSSRRALGGLLGMAIVTIAAAPARADDDIAIFVATVIVAVAIPDIVFATYGITVANKGELPSAGWSIAETILTVPQTVLANSFYATVQSVQHRDAPLQLLVLVPTIGVTWSASRSWPTAACDPPPFPWTVSLCRNCRRL